jgi:hypothetical protein
MLITAAACCLFALVGCGSREAIINDVMGGRARLLAVDGKPPRRAQGKYVTVIPFALVKPGAHEFLVRLAADQHGAAEETLLVSGKVMTGRRYRLQSAGEGVRLVEESEQR